MMRRIEDDAAFDERGLLRDGRSVRVGVMMRDGLDPLQRAVADAYGPDLLHGGGFHRPGFVLDAAGSDASERARAAQMVADANAWQNDAAVRVPPVGAYLLSAGEGAACTIDGRPGTLVRDGDWLVCRPHSRDAALSVTDAETIRARARADYIRETCDAWRGPEEGR